MGIETGTAMLLSTLFSAGASQVAASKQRSAQRNISQKRMEADKKLATEKRIASATEAEQQRTATSAADRLSKAKGTALANVGLQQKGIKKRPLASFSDISKTVLDEGNV